MESIPGRRTFWASRPSTVFATALLADASVGMLIGIYGLAEWRQLPAAESPSIVDYAFIYSLTVNDVIKSR